MLVIGVDEAGRGPLVGSVVAAAVAFPLGFKLMGLLIPKSYLKKKRRAYSTNYREVLLVLAQSSSMRLMKFNI